MGLIVRATLMGCRQTSELDPEQSVSGINLLLFCRNQAGRPECNPDDPAIAGHLGRNPDNAIVKVEVAI